MRARSYRMFRNHAAQHEDRLLRARAVVGAEAPVSATPSPLALVRGGQSQHPSWFQVLAPVAYVPCIVADVEFVTEAKTLGAAIVLASRYAFRAFVVDRHSKRQFDNGKPIEVLPVSDNYEPGEPSLALSGPTGQEQQAEAMRLKR